MLRQHLLQQQRLEQNHKRLLERYYRLLTPHISEFRTFGTSSLPGRNYEKYLKIMNSSCSLQDSLVAKSRACIGYSDDIYRWMDSSQPETLLQNVNNVMQHIRQQPMALVHAEKFEPVEVYVHPIFGPTPGYIQPVDNERQHLEEMNDNDSEEDKEFHSYTSNNTSLKINDKKESKNSSISVTTNNDDEDDESSSTPIGYISYKKWKKKCENLIPVNPLLLSIYTQRPNGSLNSYGRSLYTSFNCPKHYNQLNSDNNVFTPALPELELLSSKLPRENSPSSSRRDHGLQSGTLPAPITFRSLDIISAG